MKNTNITRQCKSNFREASLNKKYRKNEGYYNNPHKRIKYKKDTTPKSYQEFKKHVLAVYGTAQKAYEHFGTLKAMFEYYGKEYWVRKLMVEFKVIIDKHKGGPKKTVEEKIKRTGKSFVEIFKEFDGNYRKIAAYLGIGVGSVGRAKKKYIDDISAEYTLSNKNETTAINVA